MRPRLAAALCALLLAACAAEDYDAWARGICEENDALDRIARAEIRRNGWSADVEYPAKVEELLKEKVRLKARVDNRTPPLNRRGLHRRLQVALDDNIRYLRYLRARWDVGRDLFLQARARGVILDPDTIQLMEQQARLRMDPVEERMGKAYEREYDTVRDDLGLDPVPWDL